MTETTPAAPPVFLDRDGVINENNVDYVRRLEQWIPIPGSIQAIARLNLAGHRVFVVSNQSAIAREYTTVEEVERINDRMLAAVASEGERIDAVYYCPHHPDEDCSCRKPRTGMVDRAREEHDLPSGGRGYLVGDAASDMELASRAGLTGVLVLTGRGANQLEKMREAGEPTEIVPAYVARNLEEAVDWILRTEAGLERGADD